MTLKEGFSLDDIEYDNIEYSDWLEVLDVTKAEENRYASSAKVRVPQEHMELMKRSI